MKEGRERGMGTLVLVKRDSEEYGRRLKHAMMR
jgi:hypothetical protein